MFPPRWFNLMQYLLVHLSYEAKVGDPQQYRRMYHIDRVLKNLRVMVRNKARVEGCIVEQFKLKEIAYFISVYFEGPEKVTRGGGWSMGAYQNSSSELVLYPEIDPMPISSNSIKIA
jgi:hypothetical protein